MDLSSFSITNPSGGQLNTYQNLILTADFLRLTPGYESGISTQIAELTDSSKLRFFKLMGSYDLLCIQISDGSAPPMSNFSPSGILERSTISATPLQMPYPAEKDATQEENIKNCQNYPILAFLLLQLDVSDGFKQRQTNQQEVVKEINK